MTTDKTPRGFEVRMSEPARKRVTAEAEKHGMSAAAYIRSLIAAQIPELKPEFDELAQWGGKRPRK